MTRHAWTSEQIDLLKRLYPTTGSADLVSLVGHPKTSVLRKANELGLKKPPDWIAQRARERALDPTHPGAATRFKPGQQPWNAGTKGVMKPNSGTFKLGQLPHTWRPIGSDRVTPEGYLTRKTADTGVTRRDYVLIHHLVWRMHGRTVPPGYALVFRDKDRTNVDINNLELVTRQQLMKRNTVHRHGPEIAKLSLLVGAIKRQISRRKKEKQETNHAR